MVLRSSRIHSSIFWRGSSLHIERSMIKFNYRCIVCMTSLEFDTLKNCRLCYIHTVIIWVTILFLFISCNHTGTNVLSYVNMACASLRNSIPKSVVHGQVREAKRSLLDRFFTELGTKEVTIPTYPNPFLYLFLQK